MGILSFLGYIRKAKSSGQLTITIPKKFDEMITANKLVYISISDKKTDIGKGEKVEFK